MWLVLLWACLGGADDSAGCTAPGLTLLAPQDGDVVGGSPLEVRTTVECFTLVDEGGYGEDVPDDVGHIHIFLNGQEVSTSTSPTTQILDVAPGVYQLRVELALENHRALDPYVGTTVYITVQ